VWLVSAWHENSAAGRRQRETVETGLDQPIVSTSTEHTVPNAGSPWETPPPGRLLFRPLPPPLSTAPTPTSPCAACARLNLAMPPLLRSTHSRALSPPLPPLTHSRSRRLPPRNNHPDRRRRSRRWGEGDLEPVLSKRCLGVAFAGAAEAWSISSHSSLGLCLFRFKCAG
jgi:hypothetical protein